MLVMAAFRVSDASSFSLFVSMQFAVNMFCKNRMSTAKKVKVALVTGHHEIHTVAHWH